MTACRVARMLCAAVLATAACGFGGGSARAFIYWSTGSKLGVGRSNLDGTAANYDTYPELGTETCSVAVKGGYLYYGGQFLHDSIGRVPIAGGPANTDWIDGVSSPCGLAIYGNYIYWTDEPPSYTNATGSIGRASLVGPQDIHQDFITDASGATAPIDQPCGLTVNANGIYWTNAKGGAIGHANLEGTGATTLLAGAHAGCSITQAGPYLYWETSSSYAIAPDGDTIARAQLDGSAPNLLWGAGLGDPCGLASYSHYLYFGAAGGVIDQIDTDSPSLQSSETQLVQGQGSGCGIVVDGFYQGKITVARARSLPHGVVTLTLTVSNAGRISVRAATHAPALLATAAASAPRAGRVVVRLRPTGLALARLRHQPQLHTTLTVSYTPTGGIAEPLTAHVTITY